MTEPDLTKITPPKELTDEERHTIFQHFFRRLASFRNTALLYASAEFSSARDSFPAGQREKILQSCTREVNTWARDLLRDAWAACAEPGGGVVTLLQINILTIDPLSRQMSGIG